MRRVVVDTNVLPEQLEKVLQQVQANADYMPEWQLEVRSLVHPPLFPSREKP